MKVLVASASKHGSTEGIAEAIAERLRQLGHDAVAIRAADVADLHGVHAVVLGSAVYTGSWMKEATEFAEANAEIAVDACRCGCSAAGRWGPRSTTRRSSRDSSPS